MHAGSKHLPQGETDLTKIIYPHPTLAETKIPSGKQDRRS